MHSGNLSYQDNTLHFARYGTGKRLVLAFHDLGQDSSVFASLEKVAGNVYSIIAIDLPAHGKTYWTDAMSKQALVTISERFKLEFDVEQMSLLGLGTGGRFALTLAEQRSEWIDRILVWGTEGWLRAPWFGMETRNPLGAKLFRRMAAHPQKQLQTLGSLQKTGLVRKSSIAYMQHLLNNAARQALLEQVWPLTRHIVAENDKVRWQLKKYEIALTLLVPEDTAPYALKKAAQFTRKLPAATVEKTAPEHLFEHIAAFLKS